ncbi:MAG: hypothetical protein CVU46_03215 [Chloroflexi bacterium HGW-Chloroflexi-8]|jgi:hypothetical protein|nr:MAG: hypothetical protein CVU46_03215 [Chloroflexi bacterium HGW-Chloroflexi-8]
MNLRRKWLPFLILNILISIATTLLVLYFWNQAHPTQQLTIQATKQPANNIQTLPSATLPPLDPPVIKIVNVFGAGNLPNEYIVLERVGEGGLMLTGWKIIDGQENKFVFPEIELIQGQLEVYSRNGVNSANRLFWNNSQAIWESGETVRLLDYQDQERASYTIP